MLVGIESRQSIDVNRCPHKLMQRAPGRWTKDRRAQIQLPLEPLFGKPRAFEQRLAALGCFTVRGGSVLRSIHFYKGKRSNMLPIAKRTLFYGIKLPFILLLIILGFMMEYIVELPFNVLTRLDGRRRCRGTK